jgi:NTP pyrophosphatase (non-canonical NTP hydrolase)
MIGDEMNGVYYDWTGNLLGIEDTNDTRINRIIRHYGITAQSGKAVEELVELAEVLIKAVNKKSVQMDSLYEEIADVEIMLEQLKQMYDIDRDRLEQIKNMKIERTLERME